MSLGRGKHLLAARAGSVKEIKEEVLTRGGRYKKVRDNPQRSGTPESAPGRPFGRS
ncbi:hypothetical protein TRIP_B40352 [uncultured Desulfatiglans sp.]|uniref:Uncharacterized protein n=1 Tax=Uncultured Desulfatiglans sp. TaxID=1748965 RepID=A0A653AEU9_UNCDX|nr:hypothetical protein TRIP_B40352 [uncultured Desulfatiglans sp.]